MIEFDSKSAPAAAAAGLEILTGAALLVAPSLVARLLFGSGMNAGGDALGRIAGLVMLCLAVGCLPRASSPPPLVSLFALSLVAAIFLAVAGMQGVTVGVLLWPAAAVHLILAIFLARATRLTSRA